MSADIGGKNYFQIFSLPESFRVDHGDLDREYQALQSRYHPDRFAGAGDRERRVAVQTSGIINEAYETLRSPLGRAAYLLRLQGIDPEDFEQSALGGDFLLEQMELREALEGIGAREDLDALDACKERVERDINALLGEFQQDYEAGRYDQARPAYNKLQFLYKLCSEIDQIEEKILDY